MREHGKAIGVLFMSLFLVMVGFGIIIPIFPFLVLEYKGNAATLGFLMAAYSLMQFFFAPFWGKLSDRIGRRPVFLIGLSGFGLTFILFGLSTEMWMLFATRLLSGIVSSATLPTAMAYMADITGQENRAQGMGMMGGAMGMGMVFGPALGGWLVHYGLAMPFFAAGGLALLTLPFAYFFLPESLKAKKAEDLTKEQKFTGQIFKHPQFPLLSLGFVLSFSMALFESTFALFAAARVGFGPREVGIMFTILGIIGVTIQAGLIGRLVNRFGDAKMIIAGTLIAIGGLILILLAPNGITIMACTALFSGGNSLLRPSVSALMAKTAEAGQGTAMGLMQSADSLGRIIGPVAGGLIYSLNMNVPYLLGAAILLVTLLWTKPRLVEYSQIKNISVMH